MEKSEVQLIGTLEKDNALEKLRDHENGEVRRAVAECGLFLEHFKDDEYWRVRRAVARQGVGLDELVNDENYFVRIEVALKGYGLDKLINDEELGVRLVVAEKGYGLEILVDDKDWEVRRAVAEKGYGLDKLINDENWNVAKVAKHFFGSRTEVLSSKFGTYNGQLYVVIWENKYEINSGCYTSNSIEEWHEKCTEQIDKETADLYSAKIKTLIGA